MLITALVCLVATYLVLYVAPSPKDAISTEINANQFDISKIHIVPTTHKTKENPKIVLSSAKKASIVISPNQKIIEVPIVKTSRKRNTAISRPVSTEFKNIHKSVDK